MNIVFISKLIISIVVISSKANLFNSLWIIYFITYKWAQKAVVFVPGKLAQPNVTCVSLAYWAHSEVMKKIKCCEYDP